MRYSIITRQTILYSCLALVHSFPPVTSIRMLAPVTNIISSLSIEASWVTVPHHNSQSTDGSTYSLLLTPRRQRTQCFFPDRFPVTAGVRFRFTGRFDRLPVETGQIQIWIQMAQFNRFVPVYRPVRLVTGQTQFFFLFWFKLKCPQSILNKCLYNIF